MDFARGQSVDGFTVALYAETLYLAVPIKRGTFLVLILVQIIAIPLMTVHHLHLSRRQLRCLRALVMNEIRLMK